MREQAVSIIEAQGCVTIEAEDGHPPKAVLIRKNQKEVAERPQKISLNPLYPLNPCSHPSKRGVAEQILRKS